ncbi:MAG: transporter substrate-binding domain-containing protein [Chromatiales bacterium]|nr:transporter substrate-binding domain-containing protein [Chromatiales bacterium]
MRLTEAGLKLGMAAVLGLAVATGAVAQSAQQALSSESVIETIKKRGALKVGMSTFVPWAMRDKNGELVGFEIDVAKKLAADMDVDIEFVPTSWDGIIPALIAGKFDVIIGGMSIRPARNLTINFTIPYAHSGMGIAANKAMTEGMMWPDDYNAADVTYSCRRGATSCQDVERLFPKATVRKFDDDVQAFQEVLNGNAHAVLSSYPKPVEWQTANPDHIFLPTTDNLSQGDEAFGVRKGDPDALNFFSNWIQVNTTNRWLADRHHYWFKTRDWVDQVNLQQ